MSSAKPFGPWTVTRYDAALLSAASIFAVSAAPSSAAAAGTVAATTKATVNALHARVICMARQFLTCVRRSAVGAPQVRTPLAGVRTRSTPKQTLHAGDDRSHRPPRASQSARVHQGNGSADEAERARPRPDDERSGDRTRRRAHHGALQHGDRAQVQ